MNNYNKNLEYFDIDLKFRKWESVMNNANFKNPMNHSQLDLRGNGISNNDIAHVTSYPSINQSLRNILLTNIYDRPFDPMFGGNIYNQLFENLDNVSLISHISDLIHELVSRYERRIDVVDVTFNENKFKTQNRKHIINITIKYSIPTTEYVTRFTFPLERIK
jgi:phage baseplate assembly protein W